MAKKVPIGKQKLYFNIDFMNIADLLNKRCHPSLQGYVSIGLFGKEGSAVSN